MNPEQFEIFLERNEKSTAEAIERTVNGKIRTLTTLVEKHNEKHEADMADIKPIVVAFQERRAAGNIIKRWLTNTGWLGGIILTIAAVWALFFK